MAKKKNTTFEKENVISEKEKEMKLLKANYDMLVKTKEETKLRGSEESVRRIDIAIQEVVEHMKKLDAEATTELLNDKKMDENTFIKSMNIKNEIYKKIEDKLEEIKKDETEANILTSDLLVTNKKTNVQYDVIPLPSNGECYKEKLERLPVGYLTAYDENIITSPNLYRDGLVIDFLLKNKVLKDDFNVDNLCIGDADAITLFLRATSYGNEFPIMAKDPLTKENIETTIDLSEIKFKEFKLKGDENGYFDYQLPVSKDNIKFKFLTRKDEKQLRLLSMIEIDKTKASTIKEYVNFIDNSIKSDRILSGIEKQEMLKYLDKFNEWTDKINNNNPMDYTHIITNKLEMSIISINGETDRDYISNYVKNMIAKDSLYLRRYISDNEPGVDFEVEVKRPESLGGGSFKTFLEWDDSIFLNIA